MSLITIAGVDKHFGAEPILQNVSFRLERGEHAALVGSNGAGKSTLLRIIAGLEEPDAGSVGTARSLRIAYLPQVPEFDESHTLYEAMLETFAQTRAAEERLAALEHEMSRGSAPGEKVEEYGRLQAMVEHTGYDYRERIERVLAGLGLESPSWFLPVTQLSGGQRTRANLARTLLQDADVLLLDEPTNHLDIPAVEWLETYLRDLKRAFLIVAHDRYLLDRVTTRTIELSFHHVTVYDAPYSKYLALKAERMERQRFEYEAQQRHIEKTEEFVRRYGAGQRSKEARGRQKRLNRLARIERPRDEETVTLGLARPERTGDIALDVEHLVAGYVDTPLLRLPDQVVLRRGEKVAMIGPNGAGKTTLLRTLLGELPPLEGRVRWGTKTTFGYYSQSLTRLDSGKTVLEEIQRSRSMSEEEARSYLGRFLFSADDVFKTIGLLSGGERSRVALAKLVLEAPNVLVLDEPTNHLDIASRDALQDLLKEFEGTVLFVTHDRYLIDAITDQLWVISDGRLLRYAGGYSEYVSGRAKPVDRSSHSPVRTDGQASVDERVRALENEAEALANRLADAGSSATVRQLGELSERYVEVMNDLREAQDGWFALVRTELDVSSVSRGRSAAARRQ